MLDLTREELQAVLRRVSTSSSSEEDRRQVCAVVETWPSVVELLEQEGTTIDDLRERLLDNGGESSPAVKNTSPQGPTALGTMPSGTTVLGGQGRRSQDAQRRRSRKLDLPRRRRRRTR
jgi:hypothetical protein